MTRRRALSPFTLLLGSLLCYGFVLVWTQNVSFDTTTTFEELSTPFSSDLVKILTGGNYSVSVKPWESTTVQPLVSTQSDLAMQSTLNETSTTAAPQDIVTIPLPATTESLSTIAPIDGTEAYTGDEFSSAIGSTRAPPSITTNNAVNAPTERKRSTNGFGKTSEGDTDMVEDQTGITASSSVGENINKISSITTMAEDTMKSTITNPGVRAFRDLAALPRTMKRTSSAFHAGGRMTWRVKLQSSLSREAAIIMFSEEMCDAIIKNPQMKDVFIIWGAEQAAVRCV